MSEEVSISEVSSAGALINSNPNIPSEIPQDTETDPGTADSSQGSSTSSAGPAPSLPPPVNDINWDLGHYEAGEAKNILSNISEEQMSKLDEVLSLDEVQRFLEQTGTTTFPSEMSELPPNDANPTSAAADQTSSGRRAEPPNLSEKSADDKGKTENLFNPSAEPLKLEDLDEEVAHEIIKKGIHEHDVANIAVSFSDHAYALAPDRENKASAVTMATASTSTPVTPMASPAAASPRKSSRIAKRKGVPLEETVKLEEEKSADTEEDVKSADTEEDMSKTEESEDGRKEASEEDQTKGKGRGKKKAQAAPRPTRRSTRISEHEQREMAEKIRQENLRKEREEMDAMMKAKEEERLKVEQLEKEKLENVQKTEEKVEEACQTEEEPTPQEVPTLPKGAGRGRGGRRKGALKVEKPGAKAVEKEVQTQQSPKKPKGRGKGRGKKGASEESESLSQSQGSSTEDDQPLLSLTKKGGKKPKKGAKTNPAGGSTLDTPGKRKKKLTVANSADTGSPETPSKKRKQASVAVNTEAEETTEVTVAKQKAESDKAHSSDTSTPETPNRKKKQATVNTEKDIKSDESKEESKLDVKGEEKKTAEEAKPKSQGIRHRRSTGRKSESEIQALSSASDLFKPDAVIVHQQDEIKGRSSTGEVGCQAKGEDSDGGLSYEDDENDSDWEPAEFAGKLWCICKKPHGNRDSAGKNKKQFMICCDKCQGWYHGRCVGITKGRGKEMEKNNEEYVCPVCKAEKLKQSSDGDPGTIKTETDIKTENVEDDAKVNSEMLKTEKADQEKEVPQDAEQKSDEVSAASPDKPKDTSDTPNDVKKEVKMEERSFLAGFTGLTQSSEPAPDAQKSDAKPKTEKSISKNENTKDGKAEVKSEKAGVTKSYGEKIDKTLGEIRKRAAQVLAERKKKRFKGLGKDKRTFARCIVEGCGQEARPESVYCSDQCIDKYSDDSLRIIRLERERNQGHRRSSEASKKAAVKVVVMERGSGRVFTGPFAPSESNLNEWLRDHPTFEVLRPAHASHKIASSFYKKDRGEKDPRDRKHSSSQHSASSSHHHHHHHHPSSSHHHSGSAHHHSSSAHHPSSSSHSSSSHQPSSRDDSGPDPVRLNVRRSLRDVLAHRANEADDIMLSNSEIKKIAMSIEEELFNLFQETATKYKAKYRSLIFNIKDLKNKGLFRKILTNQIKSYKLVRMTAEELASKELAKWREMENKHTLEMIELAEKEAQEDAGKKHVTKKTHKGEQEVADEDLSSLVTVEAEEKKLMITSPVAAPAGMPGDFLSSLIVDTTEQHRMHLFDLNCKVCTGKVAPPSVEEPPVKKVKVARTISKDSTERQSVEKKEEPMMAAADEEKEVKEVLKVIEKVKAEDELAASTAADSTSVTVRSPDSALQSGLEITPKGVGMGVPALWKGFIHMQDLARFVTTAHRVSGPMYHLTLPDCIMLCGRIAPEQVWDYLARIRKAGSKDICVIRFDPAVGEEKSAYVQLYSYLNSRSRCGVCGNNTKQIKDLYIVPLAAHCKIPSILLPFDGPGLQDNRPHMLLGIVVKQKMKRPSESGVPEIITKAEEPVHVKRVKQPLPSSATPPRKGLSDPRRPNPLDPRARPKGLVPARASPVPQKSPLPLKDESFSDEQSYTPPERTPQSDEPVKPKINDPIVQEYGQVDLKRLEEDSQANKTSETSGEMAVEEDQPYDPEDLEGILLKPGLRGGNAGISVAGSSPVSKTSTEAAGSTPNDQKSLLMDLTRKVEEQKRQIQLKKLGLESKTTPTTGTTDTASIAPTLSTILTTLKAANLNLLERKAAASVTSTTVATVASTIAATVQTQQPPQTTSASETNWDEIFKANLAAFPPSTVIDDKTSKKEEKEHNKASSSLATESKQGNDVKVAQKDASKKPDKEEKKQPDMEKPKTELSKGSDKKNVDTPSKQDSRKSSSPDRGPSRRSSKGRDSSRRSRSRSPRRHRDDSGRKESSSRRRSRSSERRSSHSRRSGDSYSSSRRSRDRSRERSRDHRHRDRDHGRSSTDSRSPRDKGRSHSRDDRSKRSSSEKSSEKRSTSKEKSMLESKSKAESAEKAQTIEKASDNNQKVDTPAVSVASTTEVSQNPTESLQANPVIIKSKQNKTESEILDELVLGKQAVSDVSSKTESEAHLAEAQQKESAAVESPAEASATNLPSIPGLGFETTIPMSEISNILKTISKVTSSASSDVTVSSAESMVTSTVPTLSNIEEKSSGPADSSQTPPLHGALKSETSKDSGIPVVGFDKPAVQGKGDVDYRIGSTTTSAGPTLVQTSVTSGGDAPGHFSPGKPLLPPGGLLGIVPPQALIPGLRMPAAPKIAPRDVDLRWGDMPSKVGSVFMGVKDKDMRIKPPEGSLGLGSGDSDMRNRKGDLDMRVRPGTVSPAGEGGVFKGIPGTSPFEQRPQGREGSPAPQNQPVCLPLQPPPLPPPLLQKNVFTGDKDERMLPPQGPTMPSIGGPGKESHGDSRPPHGQIPLDKGPGGREFSRPPGHPVRPPFPNPSKWKQIPPGRFHDQPDRPDPKDKTDNAPHTTSAPPVSTTSQIQRLPPPPQPLLRPQGGQARNVEAIDFTEDISLEAMSAPKSKERQTFPQHTFGERPPPGVRLRFPAAGNQPETEFSVGPSVGPRSVAPGSRMLHSHGTLPRPPPPPPPSARGMMRPRGPHLLFRHRGRGRGRGW